MTTIHQGVISIATLFLVGFGAVPTRAQFNPVPFPADIGVAGFEFPAPETTIDKWVGDSDIARMAAHAWGIWIGVNQDSGQTIGSHKLRIFETWNTDQEVRSANTTLDLAPK